MNRELGSLAKHRAYIGKPPKKGGVVPFPAVGSGWFGLYLVTGGLCEVRFGRSKTNSTHLTLESGSVLCVDDSQAARVTQTEPSCTVTALCFKPTFLNVNMAAPSMLCAAYRELADRHGLFHMDAFITHQMQERTLGLIPEEAAVLGMFFHGEAGDRAAQQIGKTGLMASDIIENLRLEKSESWNSITA